MTGTTIHDPLAVSVAEARRLLGVGRDVMRRLIGSGEITCFSHGGGPTSRRMISVAELEDYLARKTAEARSAS